MDEEVLVNHTTMHLMHMASGFKPFITSSCKSSLLKPSSISIGYTSELICFVMLFTDNLYLVLIFLKYMIWSHINNHTDCPSIDSIDQIMAYM